MTKTPRIVRKDIIESELPGFYFTEENKRYAVNEEGVFFDRVEGNVFKPEPPADVPDDSYYLASYTRFLNEEYSGSKRSYLAHVYMAEIFLVKPSDEHIVNHIDGDKTNFRLSNLEWVTYSENIIHAYKTGLRTDNKVLKSLNVETKEIKFFHSLNECARHYSVTPSRLHGIVKKRKPRFVVPGIIVREEDEDFPGEEDYSKWGEYKYSDDYLVHSKNDGFATLVNTSKDCAEIVGMSHYGIKDNFRRRKTEIMVKKDFTILKGQAIEDFKQDKPEIEIIDRRKSNSDFFRKTPVVKRSAPAVLVTDNRTGLTKQFDSLEVFCNSVGLKKDTVQANIYRNKGLLTTMNLNIAYVK